MSRAQAEAALRAQRVAIDGTAVSYPGTLVFPGEEVSLDGEAVELRTPHEYWVLNKPMGVITAVRDDGGRPNLDRWLAELHPATAPVGRLDKDTTGLLLLTDDGDLAFALLKPRYHVPRTYELTIRGEISEDDDRLGALRQGVILGDGPSRAHDLRVLSSSEQTSVISLAISEGRKRQVRRMARRVRLGLVHLHRAAIGPLRAPSLELGAKRTLTPAEIASLWHSVGGWPALREAQLAALRRRLVEETGPARERERLKRILEALA